MISSIFATVSSFEASYLIFQAAHVPKIDQIGLEFADKTLVSVLQKLTDLRNLYRDFRKNPCGNFEIPVGSFLEFQVQENQSRLRALQTMLIQHVSSNPMELLGKTQEYYFSRFCEQKFEQLIHPTMESSIFSNFERKEAVLNSWRSLSVFYESFVRMASSLWLLHKLAYSFDPVVEIFQVERGVDFSMVYMEDVTKKTSSLGKTRPKVAFTVVPGFKVGRTVVQSQVYLTGTNCTE